MGQRRANRVLRSRTDREIAERDDDVFMLSEIEAGRVTMAPEVRMTLRRLAREDLILAGFGAAPTLLPRGRRILDAARGAVVLPQDDDGGGP